MTNIPNNHLLPIPVQQYAWIETTAGRSLGDYLSWHSFFGAEIPYLTDVLSSFDDRDGPERRNALLQDALDQQTALLRSLAHTIADHRAIEIRYIFTPADRRIRLFLLGKTSADDPQRASASAQRFWDEIAAAFPAMYGTLVRLAVGAPEQAFDLTRVLAFPDADMSAATPLYLAEFRRHEALEDLGLGQRGYVVYPVQSAPDSLQRLLAVLARQTQPFVVSICVRPVALANEERQALGQIASFCREIERETLDLIGRQQQIVNLPAGRVADIYAKYLHELDHPLLLRLSIASPQPIPPGICAELAIDLARPFRAGDPAHEVPNRQGHFVTPRDQQEYLIAWTNARFLETAAWGETLALAPLQRLSALVDASSAVAAWRIPIPPVGGLMGMPSRPLSQFAGLPPVLLHPSLGSRTIAVGAAHLRIDLLSKHVLIAGTIGSGKTNTCVQLLHALWAEHKVPFLVIEPVNAEHDDYRSLGHFFSIPDALRIFTIGDESTSPLRFNPFELPPGVIVNAHIAGVMSCFRAALPLDGVLPALLQEAIVNSYQQHGWDLYARAGADDELNAPTLKDLYQHLDIIAERYSGEIKQNIKGALISRIQSLILGSAGPTITAKRSIALHELFEYPTILELRHLGSDEDRALLIGFILLALQEYCDRNRAVGAGRLNHVVLLEEAHTLLQEPRQGDAGSANAKAGAVEFFTKMLAENRKYGQSFVIAEQIPTLLAQGAIKNTVTKIMHRLPEQGDIAAMGGTMNFNARHQTRAVALEPLAGEAFFYTEGMSEATLVNIPYFPKDRPLDDATVKAAMENYRAARPEVYPLMLPFEGCALCPAQCHYRTKVRGLAFEPDLRRQIASGLKQADTKDSGDIVRRVVAPITAAVRNRGYAAPELADATYCAFLHIQAQVAAIQFFSTRVVHRELQRDPALPGDKP